MGVFCEHGWPGSGCKECRAEMKENPASDKTIPESRDIESDIPIFIAESCSFSPTLRHMVHYGPNPFDDLIRGEAKGRLVRFEGRVRTIVSLETYTRLSEPCKHEKIGLSFEPSEEVSLSPVSEVGEQSPRTVESISISIGDENHSIDFGKPIPFDLAIKRARDVLNMMTEAELPKDA